MHSYFRQRWQNDGLGNGRLRRVCLDVGRQRKSYPSLANTRAETSPRRGPSKLQEKAAALSRESTKAGSIGVQATTKSSAIQNKMQRA